jgi:hypothetical protein
VDGSTKGGKLDPPCAVRTPRLRIDRATPTHGASHRRSGLVSQEHAASWATRDTAWAMSQENVEVARRGFEAFARGGPEAVVDGWDADIELWLPSGLIQAGGTYRGRDASSAG